MDNNPLKKKKKGRKRIVVHGYLRKNNNVQEYIYNNKGEEKEIFTKGKGVE